MRPGSISNVGNPEPPSAHARLAELVESLSAPLVGLLTVGLLAADQGGYFPTAWGWGALVALFPLTLWLLVGGRTEARTADVLLISALGAFAGWTALSILWSDSAPTTVLEVERALVYLSGIAAVLLLARKSSLEAFASAVLLAVLVVDAYSLSTRLFPGSLRVYDPIAGSRLSTPVGYWNGLGILTAVGIFLALGLTARAGSSWTRVASGMAVPILVSTLYFTFSRGAWIALAIGMTAAVLYDSKRLQVASWLLLLLPICAVGVFLASRSDALTHIKAPLPAAVHDGHRLAGALAVLIVGAGLCTLAGIAIERRVELPRAARLAYAAVLVAAPLLAAGAVLHRYGGPAGAASKAYESFKSPPLEGADLNTRLFSLSSNGRIDVWRVAWEDYTSHRALGSGAGTFARYWFRDRRPPVFNARDAHNLYIETLAELGPVGLALLLAALAVPLAVARRSRIEPLAAFFLAGYLALLLHAGVDWDFELPGVALGGLFCGAGLIVAARRHPARRPFPEGMTRGAVVGAAVLLLSFGLWGLIGNSAVSAGDAAQARRQLSKAESQSRKARRLMPWSPQPWVVLGFAQSRGGNLVAARSSFRRAIAKDPGDWVLWYDLAVVTHGKQREKATAEIHRLNPLSPELKKLVSRSG